MTAHTSDERLAAIEANIGHILSAVSEMRTDIKGHAETYISRMTFDTIYDSARREIEAANKAIRDEHAKHCADVEKRIDDANKRAETAEKATAALAEKLNARAWGIIARIVTAAIIAAGAYFYGTTGAGARNISDIARHAATVTAEK